MGFLDSLFGKKDKERRRYETAADYQSLHDEDDGYQQNNWLEPEVSRIMTVQPKSLVEIGFGNGRFLRAIAPHVEQVTGLDWAISPGSRELPPNVTTKQANAVTDEIPSADIVCSADVLEHFRPEDIAGVVGKLHRAGKHNFHVIACYDDNKSHLTIWPPAQWLELFKTLSDDYRLIEVRRRGRHNEREVCVIANFAC